MPDRGIAPILQSKQAAVLDRVTDHFLVAVLEDVQRQNCAREQDSRKGEDGDFLKFIEAR